jgi:sulfonate transport system substrate-binding protein
VESIEFLRQDEMAGTDELLQRNIISRRKFLLQAGLVGLAVPLGLLSCRARAGNDGGVLRVATIMGQDPFLLKNSGASLGELKIKFSDFSGGNLVVEALNADAIDMGTLSQIPAVFAAAAGTRLKIIAAIKGDVNSQLVLVPKESSVKDFAELKGKRIGYVHGTTSHYILLRLLKEAGLTLDEIKAVSLSPSDGQSAFTTGRLDAWVIYGYPGLIAIGRYGARRLRNGNGILSGDYLVAARTEAIEIPALRDAIGRYLQAIRSGYAWRDAHHHEYADAFSLVSGVPAEIVKESLDGESQPYQYTPLNKQIIEETQTVANTFVEAKILPNSMTVAPLFDFRFNKVLFP